MKKHFLPFVALLSVLRNINQTSPDRNYARRKGYAHKGIVGLLAIVSVLLIMVSCGDNSTSPTPVPTPIAEILPRSLETYGHFTLNPDNYRTNIALFSAKLSAGEGEYRLAIRQADQAAPDADAIRTSSATILRKLTVEPINLFMGFHMDTDLFDTATAWTDESGASILTDSLIEGARLQADTAYTLYALAEDGETEVHSLTDFSTDPYPADDAVGNDFFAFGFPPAQYSFVIRKGDPLLIGYNHQSDLTL